MLIHSGESLSGSVHEVANAGRAQGEPLTAMVAGACVGDHVTFTKTYDPSRHPRRPVLYDGRVNADLTEIEGTWTIPAMWPGRFVMIRPRRAPETAKARRRLAEPISL